MAHRIGIVNSVAGATITQSTQDANYPASNVKTPHSPFLPWRTTSVAADQWVVIDQGSAKIIRGVFLVHLNVTSARIQANATDSWGAPTYDSGVLTVARCPWNGRFSHAHFPASPPTLQFIRVLLPAQTPVFEPTYFRTGGIWAGDLTDLPARSLAFDASPEMQMAETVLEPEHRAWSQRLRRGEPRAIFTVSRRADLGTVKALNDNLASWLDLERQIAGGRFFLGLNLGDPSQAWVMERTTPIRWTYEGTRATAEWVVEECVAP